MSSNSHIVAVGRADRPEDDGVDAPPTASTAAATVAEEFLVYEEEREQRSFGWVVPTLAIAAILGWSGFFGFAKISQVAGGVTPTQAIALLTQWATPVLLVIAMWLLAMRSSRREASRFGDAARILAEEASRLETRLVTINRELSLARDFLAAQSRDLEALGRVASERLSENAERMSAMIHANSAQIESIASVSTTALANMDKLRDDLPVVANSARDVASQIGNAGRTAVGQLEELVNGFHRLNSFGEASERQVEALRARMDAVLEQFAEQAANLEQTESGALDALRHRLETLRDEGTGISTVLREGEAEALASLRSAVGEIRSQLDEALREIAERDADAMSQMRARLAAFGQEAAEVDAALAAQVSSFAANIEQRRSAHDAHIAAAAESLAERLATIDDAVKARQEAQLAHVESLTLRGEALTETLSRISSSMETIAARGSRVGGELAQAVELFTTRLNANKDVLSRTDAAIAGLTDASVRLLELIQASRQQSADDLPASLATAEERLTNFEARTRELTVLLGTAGGEGEALAGHVAAAEASGKAALEEIEALHNRLAESEAEQAERLYHLRGALVALGNESDEVAKRVGGDLDQATERLKVALRSAIDELGSGQASVIDDLAARIGTQSSEAIERAIRLRAAEAIGELEQAAAHASGVGREAARQLRDQLAKVDELAGNLESRVARARQQAEEQVDNDFARRVALITESLNSHAIDISKALSNDVTDGAWAAYLRGDRGIFTRRAVRLLDNSEAREIADIYNQDRDFREHVSRFIHDFEAMLRTLLSTRDGNAIGVTLLSSDMGKLYVALAQAIERLRD